VHRAGSRRWPTWPSKKQIKIGRSEINVNNWLIRKGWAFPTFYSSMSAEEIEQKLAACTIAMRYERGIWARVGDYVNRARWSLDFRGARLLGREGAGLLAQFLPRRTPTTSNAGRYR
jgi:hypothetical protein